MSASVQVVALAITGASGAIYGLRLLETLLRAQRTVYLMLSRPAQVVIGMETDFRLGGRPSEVRRALCQAFSCREQQLHVFDKEQWTAPLASGSNPADAMVICPCSMGTLASVAQGLSGNLIERAADVALKEQKKLILVPRETPFSVIHLENMLRLARMGAVILPANPGFYHRPGTVSEVINYIIARLMDHLGISQNLIPQWGGSEYEQ